MKLLLVHYYYKIGYGIFRIISSLIEATTTSPNDTTPQVTRRQSRDAIELSSKPNTVYGTASVGAALLLETLQGRSRRILHDDKATVRRDCILA